VYLLADLLLSIFNNILVYSKSLDKHVEHLHCVVSVLKKEMLIPNLKKYTFCKEKIVFLSYVVSVKGIKMDNEKVKVIKK
jgi:hypothetical protein